MSGFWSAWVILLIVVNLGITLFLFVWGIRVKIPTQPDGTSGPLRVAWGAPQTSQPADLVDRRFFGGGVHRRLRVLSRALPGFRRLQGLARLDVLTR